MAACAPYGAGERSGEDSSGNGTVDPITGETATLPEVVLGKREYFNGLVGPDTLRERVERDPCEVTNAAQLLEPYDIETHRYQLSALSRIWYELTAG